MKKKYFFCAFCLFALHFFAFGQVKITFKTGNLPLKKSAVQNLFLAGNFNGWNAADTAWELQKTTAQSYQLTKYLPMGIYNYKVTRGSWQTVESTTAGKTIENRILKLMNDTTITLNIENWQDNFAPAEKQHTASQRVHIISEKFDMPQLGRQRRIWIYLPAGYKIAKHRYPVIYMHDGQNLFDEYTAAYGEWAVDEFMDKLPLDKESIIVGIDHGGENRITEYDPFDSKYGKGRGADYVEFLVKTLKPYIDTHYRTIRNSGHTTIAGSSMGGLISMYAALKYPDVFGNAGIFSPAFWIASPDIYQYAEKQHIKQSSRFYFVCGDAESETMVSDMQKLVNIIRHQGISDLNYPVVVVKGASHNEKQWNGDFPGFYEWVLRSPKIGKSGSPKE